MSEININFNLNDIPQWFQMAVERFQQLDGYGYFLVILAIFCPPIAALLKVGLTTHFWVNVILTLLGVLPGQIHALWLVLFR